MWGAPDCDGLTVVVGQQRSESSPGENRDKRFGSCCGSCPSIGDQGERVGAGREHRGLAVPGGFVLGGEDGPCGCPICGGHSLLGAHGGTLRHLCQCEASTRGLAGITGQLGQGELGFLGTWASTGLHPRGPCCPEAPYGSSCLQVSAPPCQKTPSHPFLLLSLQTRFAADGTGLSGTSTEGLSPEAEELER